MGLFRILILVANSKMSVVQSVSSYNPKLENRFRHQHHIKCACLLNEREEKGETGLLHSPGFFATLSSGTSPCCYFEYSEQQ